MATVTLAQCWYFVQDVLRLEDGGFDSWNRLSIFIHPILLIIYPVINLVRLLGRWLLYLILLPFRTVGGAVVLVGTGANMFADQCRSFVVFLAEFYEVPSRESDSQIGGYIVLPFSSGLRVLVLAKEEEDEEDDGEEEYEDCLPLLEGGDELAAKAFFLLEGGGLTSEANDHPRDVSPLLQDEDFAMARRNTNSKDSGQPFLLEALSFRFDPGEGYRYAYEDITQIEHAGREDEGEEEEPAVHAAEGYRVDEGYAAPRAARDGHDEGTYATHVSEQRSLTTFRTATTPRGWQSPGFVDKAGRAAGRGLSIDVEGSIEDANHTPRMSRRASPGSAAEVAQESRRRMMRKLEGADGSHGSRDSPRSVLEAAQESPHGRRRKVEERVDPFRGPRISSPSVMEDEQELRHGGRREVEEEEEEEEEANRFRGTRVSPRPVREVAREVRRNTRREADDVVPSYGSSVSPRPVPEAAQEVRRRREADVVDASLYGSRASPRSVPEVAREVRRNRRREADDVPFYRSRVPPPSAPMVAQDFHDHGTSEQAEEGDRFYAMYAERVAWFDRLNAERRSTVGVIRSITLGITGLQERIDPLELSCRGAVPKKLAKCLEGDFEAIYVGQTCLCWEALHYQYRKVEDIILLQDPSLALFDATITNMFQQFEISVIRFMESEMFSGERFWNFAHRRFSDKILLQIPDVTAYNVRGRQIEEIVTANQLLDTIKSAIRSFWQFIRTDDKKEPSPWKHPWTDCPVENPRDLRFLSQIKKATKEKKVILKKLLRNPKLMKSPFEQLQIEMLIHVINLQLISRVLKMSIITTQQLLFCQEKLDSVQFNQGSLARRVSSCLFPHA